MLLPTVYWSEERILEIWYTELVSVYIPTLRSFSSSSESSICYVVRIWPEPRLFFLLVSSESVCSCLTT